MIIEKKGIAMTISDDNPIAQKIRQGHDFDIVEGKIVIGKKGTSIENKYQLSNKIQEAKNIEELKNVLSEIYKFL